MVGGIETILLKSEKWLNSYNIYLVHYSENLQYGNPKN
jgi:hypothetical protein